MKKPENKEKTETGRREGGREGGGGEGGIDDVPMSLASRAFRRCTPSLPSSPPSSSPSSSSSLSPSLLLFVCTASSHWRAWTTTAASVSF